MNEVIYIDAAKAWNQIQTQRPTDPQKNEFDHGIDTGLCMAAEIIRQLYEEAEDAMEDVQPGAAGLPEGLGADDLLDLLYAYMSTRARQLETVDVE